jgi:hypothetical protein
MQKGTILLVFFLLLFAATAGTLFAPAPGDAGARERVQIARQLNESREALLSYAELYADYYTGGSGVAPGYFPCPNREVPDAYDAPGENDAATNDSPALTCTSLAQLRGRLPRRFKMADEHDVTFPAGVLERQEFWYVLSENFQYNPKQHPHNAAVAGTLRVDGEGDVVAIILFPGAALPSQRGRPSTSAADYLDGENADLDRDFVTSAPMGEFNDQLAYITRRQYATRITARVVATLKKVLDASYAAGAYPATITGAPGWYYSEWAGTTTYVSGALDQLQFSGCDIVYTLDHSKKVAEKSQASC